MSHETLIDRYMKAREIKSNQTIKWQQDVQQSDNHCSLPEGRRCRLFGTTAWGLTFSWRLRFLYFYIPGKLDLLPICRGTQRKVMSLTFLSLSISRPAPLLSRSQQPLWHHGDPGRLHALQHIGDSVPTRLLALHLLGYLWKMILRNALWSSTLAGWQCLTMFDIDIWVAGKIIC